MVGKMRAVVRQASELYILSKEKDSTKAWRQKRWHLGGAAGTVNKQITDTKTHGVSLTVNGLQGPMKEK